MDIKFEIGKLPIVVALVKIPKATTLNLILIHVPGHALWFLIFSFPEGKKTRGFVHASATADLRDSEHRHSGTGREVTGKESRSDIHRECVLSLQLKKPSSQAAGTSVQS